MVSVRQCWWWLSLVVMLAASPWAEAQEQQIPPPLEPWRGWVLWDQEDADSPRPYNDYAQPIRVWPSRLDLTAGDQRGAWRIDVEVFDDAWVALPGDRDCWPQNVRVGEQPTPVVERNGAPAVRLPKGRRQLTGEFRWASMPQSIAVPPSFGLLTLTVGDQEIALPNWDAAGRLWLKRTSVDAEQKDLLSAQVYRLIEDGAPLWLRTELELMVSGKSREEQLGALLPAGWRLSYVESPIPVAVDNGGRVKAQVRAGKWRIQIHAFRTTPIDVIRYAADSEPIAATELIGYRAKPDFRIAELEGAPQVDVSQTTFPDRWRNVPVYQWPTDGELKLVERQRGMGDQHHDGLTINRQLWLNDDGQGYTYRDTVAGKMQRLWRLDASRGQDLSAVRAGGEPQLITKNPTSDLAGIEIRDRNLNLDAVGRAPRTQQLLAVGWEADAESLRIEFALPPGWRMLALFGADGVRGDWLTAWTLLDLFLLLVFSVAVFRLWGLLAGMLALLAFGLSYHDPFAPRYTWFLLLIPVALLRVVPAGAVHRLLTVWKWAALSLLLLCLVPFAVRQIQTALYPQLESSNAYYGQRGLPWEPFRVSARYAAAGRAVDDGYAVLGERYEAEAAPTDAPAATPPPSRAAGRRGAMRSVPQEKLGVGNLAQSSDARVQTGIAVPRWGRHDVVCYWNGPVTSQQLVRPVLLSAGLHRLLTVIKLVLLVLLAAVLLGAARPRRPSFRRGAAAAAALVAVTLAAGECQAQLPDPQLLETLRSRLLEPPEAFPHAADIAQVDLRLSEGRLSMTAEVHAAAAAAVPMPGRLPSWSPLTVTLDGEADALVCRRPDGRLWVSVPQGVHTVEIEGLLAETSEWEWTYELPPRRVTVDAPGWNVTGLSPDGVPAGQLFFTKQESRTDGEASYDQKNFDAVAVVERRLEIGLVWKVHTTVRRLSAPGKAISLKLPLLPGESVLSGGLEAKQGRVEVNLAANQPELTWESELARAGEIKLQADQSAQWVENWRLAASPVWHVSRSGLEPIYQADESTLTPEWRPWPGESVTLAFTRPAAVPGETMTVQQVTQHTSLGARQRETTLQLAVESSLGGEFVIDLEADAEVRELKVNGQKSIARRAGQQLIVPVRPGRQSIHLTYVIRRDLQTVVSADEIKLPVDGANVSTSISVPDDRWVLWAQGPSRGPAIQFWVILIFAVLVGLVLGGLSASPLSRLEWVLLAIGLTQAPLLGAMLVIGWLFLLAWRGKHEPDAYVYWRFNLMQCAIVLLTVVALGVLVTAIGEGLLGNPEMFILGAGSSQNLLNWFQPRSGPALPQPWVVTVSVWWYRLLMLFWALWIAVALLRWLQMGWASFGHGAYWRRRPTRPTPQPEGGPVPQD